MLRLSRLSLMVAFAAAFLIPSAVLASPSLNTDPFGLYPLGLYVNSYLDIGTGLYVAAPMDTQTGSGANGQYPKGSINSSDIYGANGPSTLKTANLMGLVANTPVNVIAAVAGKQIVVVGYDLSSSVAGSTVVFQDETSTPIVFDGCTFAANDHIQVYRGGLPIIITGVGAALDIAITGTSDVVKGSVTYFLQ